MRVTLVIYQESCVNMQQVYLHETLEKC